MVQVKERWQRVIQSNDGGYVLTCHTGQNQTNQCLIKVDSSGSVQWQNYITAASGFGTNMSCFQSQDNGFLMSGFTTLGAGSEISIWLNSTPAGSFQWMKTIGGTGFDVATSLLQTIDGAIVISGYTNSYGGGNNDMYIVKLDENYNSCENVVNQSISSDVWGTVLTNVPNVISSTPQVNSHTPITGSGGTLTTICRVVISLIHIWKFLMTLNLSKIIRIHSIQQLISNFKFRIIQKQF
ncbi:MAG: hypothetical protein IPL53_00065 [Ignavibacteria bacterium]|nr:hypothetical protein [Ignavibacteria bacterium]